MPEPKSLWCNRRSEETARLEELVPSSGDIDTDDGRNVALELFRAFSNAYYDIFNNGAGNFDGRRGRDYDKVCAAFPNPALDIDLVLEGIRVSGSANDYYYEPLETLGDIIIDLALAEQFHPAAS